MISVSNFIRIIVLSVLFFFLIELYSLRIAPTTILIFGLVCLFLFRINFLLKLLNVENDKTISLEVTNKAMFQTLLGLKLGFLMFGFGGLFSGLFDLVIEKTPFYIYYYFKLFLTVLFVLMLLFFKPKLRESNPKKQFLELLLNAVVVYLLFFKIVYLLEMFFVGAATTDYNYFKSRNPFMDYSHILVYAAIYLVLTMIIFFAKNKIIDLFFNKINIDNENLDTVFVRYGIVIFSLMGIIIYLVDFFTATIDYIGCLAPNRHCDIMFMTELNYGPSLSGVQYYLFVIFLLFFVFVLKNKKISQLLKP